MMCFLVYKREIEYFYSSVFFFFFLPRWQGFHILTTLIMPERLSHLPVDSRSSHHLASGRQKGERAEVFVNKPFPEKCSETTLCY